MNRLEKILYTAKAHTTGGRTGTSRSSDGRLEVTLSRPGHRHQSGTTVCGRLVRLLPVGDGVRGAQHEDHAAGR
jgi:hypothetical protein